MTINQAAGDSILNLILRAVAWANIADNAASGPLTDLWVALHTADPGATGNQTTNEVSYTSYARVAIARTTMGWGAASAGATSPAANITFPTGTGGSGTATFASVGTASSGTGTIILSGPVSPAIVTGNGVTPALTTSSVASLA